MHQIRKHGHFKTYVLIGALCLFVSGQLQAQTRTAPSEIVVLLTEEEADRFRLTEEQFEWQVEFQRGTLSPDEGDQPGPRIELQSPAITDGVVRATTPLDLSVGFRPNQAPIDIGSLEVLAKKGPFKRIITNMVLPYLVPDGDGFGALS